MIVVVIKSIRLQNCRPAQGTGSLGFVVGSPSDSSNVTASASQVKISRSLFFARWRIEYFLNVLPLT